MSSLIHDWNGPAARGAPVMLDDETLRDGLQSPSVRTPDIDQKIAILHLIDKLGLRRVAQRSNPMCRAIREPP